MDKVREEFEAWAGRQWVGISRKESGEYVEASTERAWLAWQAARQPQERWEAVAQEGAATPDYWLSDDGDILPFEPSEDAKASVDWAPFYSGTTVDALRAQLAERSDELTPTPATVATEAVAQECPHGGKYDEHGGCAKCWSDCHDGRHQFEQVTTGGGLMDRCKACGHSQWAGKPVAKGGGVDAEKVMALVEEYSRCIPGDCGDAVLSEIRAPLSAAPAGHLRPDCSTCANRGRVDGLSQETHCGHCCWRESWRTDHYAPALRDQLAGVGGYVSAGVVINNNQPGSQYIVEAHHGQTVCVGTEVFIK